MDTIVLSNGFLRCEIALRGAELRSLCGAPSGEEFIWQRDPAVWGDSAPILFPVVGRLRNGGYTHQGQRYGMAIHGFARHQDFTVLNRFQHSATLVLRQNAATLAQYPFRFTLLVRFSLDDYCLSVNYQVINEGDQTMPFSLGSHPGFRLPGPRGLSDWKLVFSEQEEPLCYRLDGDVLASVPEPVAFEGGNRLQLSSALFERDALIFKGIRSRHVRLAHRSGRIRLSVATGGAPDLGIWTRPDARYVCIEPWYGYDDGQSGGTELSAKPGVVLLPAGETFRTCYSICTPPSAV